MLSLIVFNRPTRAQTPPINDVRINYIAASAGDQGEVTVSAYVSVIAQDGQPISGLPPDNFTVFENGTEVAVESVSLAADPMASVLVIDTSGSMAEVSPNGQLAIEMAKQAAGAFVSGLEPEDKIAVFSFNDAITLEQDLTVDHNAAINAINQLTYKDFGGTCLFDAAIEAIEKSAEVIQGRRAIILLTDGVDETGAGPCSIHTLGDVVSEATKPTNKVPIFTVGFGRADERELLRLANLTGGRGQIAQNATELGPLFETISQQLKNQYLVTYQTTAASGQHSVVVKVERDGVSKSDERLVFVPVSAQPTPVPTATSTPAPLQASITDARKDAPQSGSLEIVVDISAPEQVVKAELFIDDVSSQALTQPPFDRFVLDMDALSPGAHLLRLEVSAADGTMAIDEREITITAPPTPSPQPTPVPTPQPAPPLVDPRYVIVGVAGCLILLIIAGTGAFIVMGRRKATPPPPAGEPAPLDAFITQDEVYHGGADIYQTIDEVFTIDAGLIVLESEKIQNKAFKINKEEVVLGRDAGGTRHDINIPDNSVSRNHARIVFEGQSFKIFDNGSRNGTVVNGKKVGPEGMSLPDGAEIQLGKKTRLRFKAGRSGMDPYQTMDDVDDPYKTDDNL